jgi:hypothetical protein
MRKSERTLHNYGGGCEHELRLKIATEKHEKLVVDSISSGLEASMAWSTFGHGAGLDPHVWTSY